MRQAKDERDHRHDSADDAANAQSAVVSRLLDEQYEAVEAYCNAQISLYNAIHSKPGGGRNSCSARLVLRSYSDALSSVQASLGRLHEAAAAAGLPRNERALVRDHLGRMDHVLALIGGEPLVHPNGVPTARPVDADTFTLALSAARASARVVKDAMG
jgi:hypothetical protein